MKLILGTINKMEYIVPTILCTDTWNSFLFKSGENESKIKYILLYTIFLFS